ncbi:MAG: hypothetical protein DRH50_16860 [Deltaproteobacteria bacterium]|nr:MAG: hypothetical protein DRH50_16860 [Deltaproteobacteria bacterium]
MAEKGLVCTVKKAEKHTKSKSTKGKIPKISSSVQLEAQLAMRNPQLANSHQYVSLCDAGKS